MNDRATVDLVKTGWLVRHKRVWQVTIAGRQAYNAFPGSEAFSGRLRRRWSGWWLVWRQLVSIGQGTPVFGKVPGRRYGTNSF